MPINRAWGLSEPPQAVLPPNSSMVYNLRDLQGYDSLLTGRYMGWATTLDGGSPAPPENGNMVFTYGIGTAQAREAGAQWIVSGQALPPNPEFQLAYQGTDGFVYRDARALPRVRAASGAQAVSITDSAPTLRLLTVTGDVAGQVTLADQWYPGWWARQEGGAWQRVERTEYIFQSVPLQTAEAHFARIETRYRPASFEAGLYALGLTLAWAASLLGMRWSHGVMQKRRQALR